MASSVPSSSVILESQIADSQATSVVTSVRYSAEMPPSAPASNAGDNRKLLPAHLVKIVDWLEIPENFAMLNGSSRRLPLGVRHPNKKTVYQMMLVVLHANGFPRFVSTGENLGKRFTRYLKKYKEAFNIKNDSGSGLTMGELRAGITLDEKLEKICPHFQRMHILYGERANVQPPSTATGGMYGIPELYTQQSDEDNVPETEETEGTPFYSVTTLSPLDCYETPFANAYSSFVAEVDAEEDFDFSTQAFEDPDPHLPATPEFSHATATEILNDLEDTEMNPPPTPEGTAEFGPNATPSSQSLPQERNVNSARRGSRGS